MPQSTIKSASEREMNPPSATDDLAGDVAALKQDMSKLAKQLQEMGERSYGTARRAASLGVDQILSQGEAALAGVKSTTENLERQLTQSVREKPLTALALAMGAGMLVALLARR